MGAKQRMRNELTRVRGLEFKLGFCPSPLSVLVTSAQEGPFSCGINAGNTKRERRAEPIFPSRITSQNTLFASPWTLADSAI